MIPKDIAERTRKEAKFTVGAIREQEDITGHDVMAFIRVVSKSLSPDLKPFFHAGLTSYDVVDTALAIQVMEATSLITDQLIEVSDTLLGMAKKYKYSIQIGRTHGVHAEPITFGLKMLNWYDEVMRHFNKLVLNEEFYLAGKASGAVGTFAHLDPQVEVVACSRLKFRNAEISTQIVSRDRLALYIFLLASICASLEKFATEIRNLHRTEIREVQEPSRSGQKGSSAMPHKKALPNCISAENICSVGRVVQGYTTIALNNQAHCWHERSLDNSAAERIILPDASTYTHYALWRFNNLLKRLEVDTSQMEDNLNLTGGIIFSEPVMLALAKKGMPREEAHELLQELAKASWIARCEFRDLLVSDAIVSGLLTESEIDECLNPQSQLRNIDKIFARFQA